MHYVFFLSLYFHYNSFYQNSSKYPYKVVEEYYKPLGISQKPYSIKQNKRWGKFQSSPVFLWDKSKWLKKQKCKLAQQPHHTALHLRTTGKMKFYLYANLFIILFCLSSRHSSVTIKSELQKNVLKFGYGINYKH